MNKQTAYQTLAFGALAPLSGAIAAAGLANFTWKWSCTLAALIVAGLVYFLLGALLSRGRFPQWLHREQGFGPALLRWLIAVYGLSLAAALIYSSALFWQAWTGDSQPLWLLLLLLAGPVLGCGLLGRQALLRATVLTMALLPLLAIGDTLLLAGQYQWAYLTLPSLDLTWLTQSGYLLAAALAPAPLLLYLVPAGNGQGRRLIFGYGLAAAYYLLTATRDTLVLGSLVTGDTFPLLRTLAMVKLGVGLERVEFGAVLLLLALSLHGASLWLSPLLELCQSRETRLAAEGNC